MSILLSNDIIIQEIKLLFWAFLLFEAPAHVFATQHFFYQIKV